MNTYLVTFVACGHGEITKILEEKSMANVVKTIEDNFLEGEVYEIKELKKIK